MSKSPQVFWRRSAQAFCRSFLRRAAEFPHDLRSNGVATESLLIITGTMGAGKSAVLGDASDILALRHVVHAAIDLDGLGLAHLPSRVEPDGVMYGNLESVCKNYAALGVRRFVVARAIERRAELELVRSIVSATKTVVCRLTASLEAMQQRVRMREAGVLQAEYVARVAKLNAILDGARLEDFTVANENRSLSEVAHEVLFKAGWIPDWDTQHYTALPLRSLVC